MTGKSLKAFKLLFIYPALSFLPMQLAYRLAILFSPMDPNFEKAYMKSWIKGLKRCIPADGFTNGFSYEKCAKEHLKILSMEALDSFLVPRLNHSKIKRLVEIRGVRHLKEALRLQKGVIIVTSHFSRLNMTAYTLGFMGIKSGFLSQSVDRDNPYLDWIDRIYLRRKIKKYLKVTKGPGLTLKENPRKIYKALQKNHILVILMDAYPATVKRFYQVPFLGGTLSLPQGIARISKKTGSPLVFTVVRPRGKWKVVSEIRPIDGIGEEGLRQALGELEKEVLDRPYLWWQWSYMNSMWKPSGRE